MAERLDVAADSVAVMFPIPPEIASEFPEVEGNGEPHITGIHIGSLSEADFRKVCRMVAEVLPAFAGETVALGTLGYCDNLPNSFEGRRAAYAGVEVSDKVREARNTLDTALREAGFDVQHYSHDGDWHPHATLAYLDGGKSYVGTVPRGEWTIDAVEVWRGDDRMRLYADGYQDRLGRKGNRWVALSEDGKTEFGTYATEEAARERLRQVEAAKAAKDAGVDLEDDRLDAPLTEDERAEIRSRWAKGEGPNMGAARMREWLDSPFAGPNRKTGDERARARRVANRALRLMDKSTADWTESDYRGALQVMAYIARAKKIEQGEPLVIDGREGPSARDAALRDWGYDIKRDAPTGTEAGDRSDAQQVLFEQGPDGSLVLTVPAGVSVKFGQRADHAGIQTFAQSISPADADGIISRFADRLAPAVHTESRVHVTEVWRADKVEFPTEFEAVRHPDGWVMFPIFYSRAGNIQEYDGVREYRPRDEVFKRASMDTGIGDPWELRHSKDLLNPRTVLGVARGAIVTVDQFRDNEHTFGWAKAWDAELLRAIEGDGNGRPEAPEVSVAFRCKLDHRGGHDDFGRPFDRRQFDIIWNSLASEPYGRAVTARVLTSRADARDGMLIRGADQMLAVARADSRPAKPIYFDRSEWTRFDRSTRKDSLTMELIQAMLAKHGMTMADLAAKMTMAEADLMAMLERGLSAEEAEMLTAAMMAKDDGGHMPEEQKTMDAMGVTLDESLEVIDQPWDSGEAKQRIWAWSTNAEGVFDATKAATLFLLADPATDLKGDMHMPVGDIVDGSPKINAAALRAALGRLAQEWPEGVAAELRERAKALAEKKLAEFNAGKDTQDMEMMKIMIGDMEVEVPPAVADYIKMLEGKAEDVDEAMDRADRAGKRADKAEASLAKVEADLTKRKDAMADMVSRADAEAMIREGASEWASAMELARRVRGFEWSPEARKDAASGEALPITLDDWRREAIRGAFGNDADTVLARIDAAPAGEVREFLMRERLEDARARLDAAAHTSVPSVQAFAKMRAANAEADRKDSEDKIAAARERRAQQANNYVGATQPRTNGAA